jgi:hypothetical protein
MNENEFRDVCAMLAMSGYMAKMGCNPLERGAICEEGVFADNNADAIAKASYIIADAMLEARNKVPEDDGGIATIKKRKYVRKD